jgi:hypothetical protein
MENFSINCRLLNKWKLPMGPKEIGKRSWRNSSRKRSRMLLQKVHCNIKWDLTVADAKLYPSNLQRT